MSKASNHTISITHLELDIQPTVHHVTTSLLYSLWYEVETSEETMILSRLCLTQKYGTEGTLSNKDSIEPSCIISQIHTAPNPFCRSC